MKQQRKIVHGCWNMGKHALLEYCTAVNKLLAKQNSMGFERY